MGYKEEEPEKWEALNWRLKHQPYLRWYRDERGWVVVFADSPRRLFAVYGDIPPEAKPKREDGLLLGSAR
jgi:hypothetical protein